MDVATLATTVAVAVAPLLAKGAEKFVEEFGKDVYEKSKTLLDRVRKRLKGKPTAEKALVACEQSPGPESQTALAEVIQGELVADQALASQLAPLAQELAVLVHVTGVTAPKYQVTAKVIGAVGDHAQATLHLGQDALAD
jgi:hypothetical protein